MIGQKSETPCITDSVSITEVVRKSTADVPDIILRIEWEQWEQTDDWRIRRSWWMRMMCECEGGYFRTYSARTTVVFVYRCWVPCTVYVHTVLVICACSFVSIGILSCLMRWAWQTNERWTTIASFSNWINGSDKCKGKRGHPYSKAVMHVWAG